VKLKHCPFCGGKARFFEHIDDVGDETGGLLIECSQCKASSAVMHAEKFDPKPLLAESWNTRAGGPVKGDIPEKRGDYWVMLSPTSSWQVVYVRDGKIYFHRGGVLTADEFGHENPHALWGERLVPPTPTRRLSEAQ
jgi:Lar family restriction alleviation protein